MDLKSFFKNKNVIVILVVFVIIFLCAALSKFWWGFMPIAVILSGFLCLFFAYLSFVAYKKQTSGQADNTPQTKSQKIQLRFSKSYGIGQIFMFIVFALTFIVMGINMF